MVRSMFYSWSSSDFEFRLNSAQHHCIIKQMVDGKILYVQFSEGQRSLLQVSAILLTPLEEEVQINSIKALQYYGCCILLPLKYIFPEHSVKSSINTSDSVSTQT